MHSCNDLAQWPNLVRKGARSFKVDPRWVEWNAKSACRDPTGCLVLSHDPPLPRLLGAQPAYYNFLEDVLDLLAHVEPIRSVARREGLRIALCFKGTPGNLCNQGEGGHSQQNESSVAARAATRWLRKVDTFVSVAKDLLQAQGLEESVTFVLDGGGVPVGCLAQRWRPWPSVWMSGSGPAEAFLSDAVWDGSDRFQVLNEPADPGVWQALADPILNYGKFSGGPYPYQVWEPGGQARIRSFIEIFHGGRPHPPGLDFASNSDVAMFQVYAGLGLNQGLDDGAPPERGEERTEGRGSAGCGEGVGGLVTVVRPGLALVLPDRGRGEYRMYTFDPDQPLAGRRGLREGRPAPAWGSLWLPGFDPGGGGHGKDGGGEGEGARIQTFSAWGDTLLVGRTGGDYLLYDTAGLQVDGNATLGEVVLRYKGAFQASEASAPRSGSGAAPGRGSVRLRRTLLSAGGQRFSFSSTLMGPARLEGDGGHTLLEVYIDLAWRQAGCRLAYQVLDCGGGSLGDRASRQRGCLWWAGESAEGRITPEHVPDVESAVAVAVQHAGGVVALVFAAAGGGVFLTRVPDAALSPWAPAEEVGSGVVQIGVGHSVAASAVVVAGPRGAESTSLVMLVVGGGFCYNSHLHNTGPRKVCELTPRATPGVLDYTYGLVLGWLQLLRGPALDPTRPDLRASAHPRRHLVNPCHPTLLHGSYDLGYSPAVALFPSRAGGMEGVGMLEIHRAFEQVCPLGTLMRPGRQSGPSFKEKEEDTRAAAIEAERGQSGQEAPVRELAACACGAAIARPAESLVADSFSVQVDLAGRMRGANLAIPVLAR